jgi:Cu(I)/Ag(I) efflux system membrane protein CusA/SilA
MIAAVVRWCARHPWLVIALAVIAAAAGERARRGLSRDALADVSDPQVAVVADWMGHAAPEVAQRVTGLVTQELHGIAGTTAVRGASMAGMAYVDVVFGSPRDLETGRTAIAHRLEALRPRLPVDVRLQVGPSASSVGWVFQYALVDRSAQVSAVGLRRLQDDYLAPALSALPGVAEVATVGGGAEHVMVQASAEQLRLHGLAFSDLTTALRGVPRGQMIRKRQIEALPLGPTGDPAGPRVIDVASVMLVEDMPTGSTDLDGVAPAVGAVVVARRNVDTISVIAGVKAALEELRTRLPASVELVTVYDRSLLVAGVEHTLTDALAEEIGVVVLVILMFLLHGRSALVPLISLPVVLCLTFAGMWLLDIPATVMSLGGIGIALGMALDADIVALEACHRRLEHARAGSSGRRDGLLAAARTVAPAISTSLVITALSFLPVLGFAGETGRMLRPLAITKTLVILAAAIVAVTLGPALRDRLVRGRVIAERANPLTRSLLQVYRPFVQFALEHPALSLAAAALAIASCLPIVGRLGGEYLPRIDEGDLLFMPTTAPGVPPGEAAVQLARQDRALRQQPEVAQVFGKVGRATTATDPAPFAMAETIVHLRPRDTWPRRPRSRWYSSWAPDSLRHLLGLWWPETAPRTTAELIEQLDRASRLPGWTSAWTSPVRARLDMMSTGIRTQVALRVVAGDVARLDALTRRLRDLALRQPGTRSAVLESAGGERWPVFVADPAALAAYHVDPEVVRSTAALVLAGGQVGELVMSEPGKPYRMRAVIDTDAGHGDAPDLRDVTVRSSTGQPVSLALLGRPGFTTVPAMLRAENGELVAYVYIDLDPDADVLGYVERGQHLVDSAALGLGAGERIEWAGQYPLIADGLRSLAWIVPVVAISMLGLLLLQLRSVTEALLVLVSVPFALVGSFWTLYLLDYRISAPVWVGLLSTVGLAMQTGIVMVVYIDEAFHRRVREGRLATRADIIAAHAEGTVARLRPKIMTITTMAAGLLPLLWADGAGAEVIRRIAAPMLGGLATSAILTLEVLPVLYTLWRYAQLRRAQAHGVPIATIVGPPPPWARS